MRNTFTITVTDFRGARHYPIRQIAKAYALGFIATVAATLLVGGLVIVWLNSQLSGLNAELSDLQQRRNITHGEYAMLLSEHDALKEAVAEKEQLLLDLSEELGQLEILIGVEPAPAEDIVSRLDTASQTATEKMVMLQTIPSGYPVEYRGLTSRYGYRTHPVRNTRAFHSGADLRAGIGTPVYATADGVVEWAASHGSSGMGNLVIVNHSFGFSTYYGHLSKFAVKAGDFIRKGDLIAYTGNTGMSSGPHLHYEVRHLQRRLDPTPFMEWTLNGYDSLFEKEGSVQWDSLAKVVKERLTMPGRRSSPLEVSFEEN